MLFKDALLIAVAVLSFSVRGYCNTIPGPGVGDAIALCNSNNTNCQTLAGPVGTAASFSGPVTGGGTQISVNGLADATGGPGNMKAYSSYTLTVANGYFSQFQSNASFGDDVTVNAPGEATGTLGYLVFDIQTNGMTTPNGLGTIAMHWQDSVGTAAAAIDVAANCPGQSQASQITSGGCYFFNSTNLIMNPIPFHFGDPIWLQFYLGAGTYPGSVSTGTADYSHTSTLTGIQVLDTNMNPVSTPTFGSAAGVEYSVNGVVPEPGTLLLLGSALSVFGILRYARR